MGDSSSGTEGVGDFLDSHYSKFAIMGIFGTVTVFLNNQWLGDSSSLTTRLATVASLLIFGVAAIWIAGNAFSEISSEGPILSVTDVGFVLIFLCTGILGVVMVITTSLFALALQILAELALSVVVVLVYARLTPIMEYSRNDTSFDDIDTSGAVAIAGLFSLFLTGHYSNLVTQLTENSLNISPILITPIVVAFFTIHYILTEGTIGLMIVAKKVDNRGVDGWQEILSKPWPLRVSLAVSLMFVGIITIQTNKVAETAIGPNFGYYQILNVPSVRFTFFHWILATIGFLTLVLLERGSNTPDKWLKRGGKGIAVVLLGMALVDLLLLVPGGRLVIPLG